MNLPIPLKTLANVLGIALLIALVAPFVVYAVPGLVGAEHSFVVLTASMTPAIAPGDVVIVDERDPATIAEGDVITFLRGGNEVPVTHRVIGVADGPTGVAFETQGDANGAPDASLVPGENVLGVVAITIPYIGYVIQFTDSPLGFAALVVVPFGLLVLSELWSLARNPERDGDGDDGDDGDGDSDDGDDGDGDSDDSTAAFVFDGAEGAAGGADSPGDTATDATVGEISLDTITGAGAVLAAFAPYSIYVAFQLRTALAFTVAIAAAVGCLGAIATWISASGVLDREQSPSVTPAGSADSAGGVGADNPRTATDGSREDS